jgi:uncharacterized RmlC-like cupin family protein
MSESKDWRDGVRVTRGASLAESLGGPQGGRATALEFAGTGGMQTWIGRVTMAPGARTSGHRHGRHEVALYVIAGAGRMRWGEQFEHEADVGPGDFIYFTPHVPHEEVNLSAEAALDFVVIRSDGERIFEKLA